MKTPTPVAEKRVIAKNTLSFAVSKSYKFIRTPAEIWEKLDNEFHFTLDACASDQNHLTRKYYTAETNALDQDWTGEIVYCHPMFDIYIPKFVEKCATENCTAVMLLPASTHTRYFHKWIWDKEVNRPRANVRVRFLEKPERGFNFGHEDGTIEELGPGRVGYIKPLMVVIFYGRVYT